ncbi:MAG: hypothetical protein ACRDI1_12375 [Actinomycetota bacterium]
MTESQNPRQFVRTRKEVEASIMPIGLNTAQVILVAEDGEWLRFVVPSMDAARKMCERLKIQVHEGYPEHLRRRIGAYRRSNRDWADAPYPERFRDSST